jgi:ubiquinone/menaquinone biosynthesis C-methylase UbiE
MQTIELARLTDGRIVAVDTHQSFLDELAQHARDTGVADRIETCNQSMFSLAVEDKSVDVIWSEGAIYIMGFEQGLRAWRPFLKPGGYVAVTEITWLRSDPPEELRAFWAAECPAMQSVQANLDAVRAAGYREIAHFVLPPSAWWTHYYTPLEARVATLRKRHLDDPEAQQLLKEMQREIDLFRKYSDWYGYVFYVMQIG